MAKSSESPIYKQWWFCLVIGVIVVFFASMGITYGIKSAIGGSPKQDITAGGGSSTDLNADVVEFTGEDVDGIKGLVDGLISNDYKGSQYEITVDGNASDGAELRINLDSTSLANLDACTAAAQGIILDINDSDLSPVSISFMFFNGGEYVASLDVTNPSDYSVDNIDQIKATE